MSGLPEHLRLAARQRTQQAAQRAEAALRELSSAGQAISFSAVARRADVSTDFLYAEPRLRAQIERTRSQPRHAPADEGHTGKDTSAVRALTQRLNEQRREHARVVGELRRALEVAHGENLELRRELARHRPGLTPPCVGQAAPANG